MNIEHLSTWKHSYDITSLIARDGLIMWFARKMKWERATEKRIILMSNSLINYTFYCFQCSMHPHCIKHLDLTICSSKSVTYSWEMAVNWQEFIASTILLIAIKRQNGEIHVGWWMRRECQGKNVNQYELRKELI